MAGYYRSEVAKKNYFAVDESNQERQEDIKPVKTCREMATEASKNNLWIYDPSNKAWQTPEEFLNLNERISKGNETYLKRVKMKCPFEGIQAAHQQINSI